MTPAEIALAKGASDIFVFDYAYVDLADTIVFNSDDWGLYSGTDVDVSDAIRPGLDVDGTTSLASSWTASVTLFHLTTFSTAHVEWEGSGFTVEYTLDGTVWTTISNHAVISLAGDPDFDIRVNFAGGVVEDTAELTSLTVYVLQSDTLFSVSGDRTITFNNDPIIDGGMTLDATVTVSAAATLDTADLVGTIEMWVQTFGSSTIFASGPAGTDYRNGAAGSALATATQHFVRSVTTPANVSIGLATAKRITHLAIYPTAMTSTQVAALYAAQAPTPTRLDDPGGITVTEPSPPTNIYAYAWSFVSG